MKITCVYVNGDYIPCWFTGKEKEGMKQVMVACSSTTTKANHSIFWAKLVDIREWDFIYFKKLFLKQNGKQN